MNFNAWFQCINGCSGRYELTEVIYRCPTCDDLLEVTHDMDELKKRSAKEWKTLFDDRYRKHEWPYGSSVWGKKELVCPNLDNDNIVSTYEGGSNLFYAERFGQQVGVDDLWVKQCGLSHTGSFKDIGMTVLVSMVKQMRSEGKNIRAVACASTGDTSAALAAYCAVAGIPAIVFLPKNKVSLTQLIQPITHGVMTISLDTDFDGCMRLVKEISQRENIYLANSMNSLRIEGQKTVAIELVQQFNWEVPDWIIIPGGNLGNVSALGKGLLEMRDMGMINRLPRIAVGQAEQANPLYRSYRDNFNSFEPIQAGDTMASAIKIGDPVSRDRAIRTLRAFDGVVEQASEILRFGAAVVVMAFDEQGQADSYDRMIELQNEAGGGPDPAVYGSVLAMRQAARGFLNGTGRYRSYRAAYYWASMAAAAGDASGAAIRDEIEEFIELRRPTGGDPNRKTPNLHHGVLIPDAFMRAVEGDEEWALTSPKDRSVLRTVKARELWIRILTARIETGEPYIINIDHVNKAIPEHQKLGGLSVKTSNLCSEITLPTGKDRFDRQRTAVCCLSSLNLETYSEWEDHPQFIEDVMRFLDNALQDFIDQAPEEFKNATYSAMRERSVGLGVMGFHSFLQANGIPIESVMSTVWNKRIFNHIRAQADEASVKLAEERGACPDAADFGITERFSNKMSLAPTASISIICGGASPGIEPIAANSFTHKTLSGSFTVRNKYLTQLLEEKGRNTDETWSSIVANEGSVQHLDFLSDLKKDVFKTAFEIDQRWLIDLAADRTPNVCQSQSLNVFLPADIHKRDLHQIHYQAWKKGVKSLYYCRSKSLQRSESEFTHD